MRKRIRKISQRQEKQAAKDVGGRVQAGSGNARLGGGGDVRDPGRLRIECKYTEMDSYLLRHEDLKKIRLQALKGGLEAPVLQIAFKERGRFDKYAIVSRPRPPLSIDPQVTYPHKSARLHREWLRVNLLNQKLVSLGFQESLRTDWYDVMKWNTFMELWEKMNARDTDDR